MWQNDEEGEEIGIFTLRNNRFREKVIDNQALYGVYCKHKERY